MANKIILISEEMRKYSEKIPRRYQKNTGIGGHLPAGSGARQNLHQRRAFRRRHHHAPRRCIWLLPDGEGVGAGAGQPARHQNVPPQRSPKQCPEHRGVGPGAGGEGQGLGANAVQRGARLQEVARRAEPVPAAVRGVVVQLLYRVYGRNKLMTTSR